MSDLIRQQCELSNYDPPGEGCYGCKSLARRIAANEQEIERLREVLRTLSENHPVVECQNFHHRKHDLEHDWNDCGPMNRWIEAWERADALLEKQP